MKFEVFAETKGPIEPLASDCPVTLLIDLRGGGEFEVEATDSYDAARLTFEHCKDVDVNHIMQVMAVDTRTVDRFVMSGGDTLVKV